MNNETIKVPKIVIEHYEKIVTDLYCDNKKLMSKIERLKYEIQTRG